VCACHESGSWAFSNVNSSLTDRELLHQSVNATCSWTAEPVLTLAFQGLTAHRGHVRGSANVIRFLGGGGGIYSSF